MNILFIAHENTISGSTIALINIISILKDRHNLAVVCPIGTKGDSPLIKYLRDNNIACYDKYFFEIFIYSEEKNVLRRIIRNIGRVYRHYRLKKYLRQIFLNFKPDIVHTNNGPLLAGFDVSKEFGIPHVWHLREYQDWGYNMHVMYSKRAWLKKVHSPGNFNIAISKGIFKYFNLRPDFDTVIYDGVFHEYFKPQINEIKEDYITYIGNLCKEEKGFLDALVAFSEISKKHDSICLQAVGFYDIDDSYYKKCYKFISENRLERKVKILGIRSDIYEILRKSRALIITSHYEGFGFTCVEAMLNNCIVIARNEAGIKEQMDNGVELLNREVGFRFNNIQELISCIEQSLSMNTESMRHDAYQLVCSLYTIEKSVSSIESFYSFVLKRFKAKI